MLSVTTFDLRACDPPTIRWGKHTKNKEISRIFNDRFSFELPDEAWGELFTNNPVTSPVDISKAVIPTKIVERIRTAIGIHILLPFIPGDEPSKLLCYKQILDLCPLYVGYNSLGRQGAQPLLTRIPSRTSKCGSVTRTFMRAFS